jgi:hypothetical protein
VSGLSGLEKRVAGSSWEMFASMILFEESFNRGFGRVGVLELIDPSVNLDFRVAKAVNVAVATKLS